MEIEKSKTTINISVLKVEIIKVVLVYLISNFFTNKNLREKIIFVKKFIFFFQLFLKFLDVLTIFMTFWLLTRKKNGQIYNGQYLSFQLTPSLHTFVKIDVTYENGTQKPKNTSVKCELSDDCQMTAWWLPDDCLITNLIEATASKTRENIYLDRK